MLLTEEHLRKAWALVESLESQMTRAYEAIGTENVTSEEILKFLRSKGMRVFTRISVTNKFKIKYDVKQINKALDILIRTGQIKYKLDSVGLTEVTFELVGQDIRSSKAGHLDELQR